MDENEIYKKMYYRLFNKVTDALNCETKTDSDAILLSAQTETEEMYMNNIDDNIVPFPQQDI